MTTPIWAQALLAVVADEYGRSDKPELHWRRWPRGKARLSSGRCRHKFFPVRIWVTARRDPIWFQFQGKGRWLKITARVDQKMVLLHELAHWLMGPDEGHSAAFWLLAWQLYRRHSVQIKHALERETFFFGELPERMSKVLSRSRVA